MKLRKKIFAIIAYLSMMVGRISLATSLGWFYQKVTTGNDIYGESARAYFAYGDGSKEFPMVYPTKDTSTIWHGFNILENSMIGILISNWLTTST